MSLFGGKRGQQLVFVGQVHGCDCVEQLAAGVGEGDEDASAVAGVGFTADQASFAEVIDPTETRCPRSGGGSPSGRAE